MKGKLLLKVYEGNDKVLLYNEKKGKRCLKKESNWVRLYVLKLSIFGGLVIELEYKLIIRVFLI